MRKRYIAVVVLFLIGCTCLGSFFYVKSELEFLRVYVPSVADLTSYMDEVSLTIYGTDDFLMYKKYYRMSERLPENFDMTVLTATVDMLVAERRDMPRSYGIERWKLYLMNMQDIDPFTLRGAVLNHYADRLLSETDIHGFRAEVLRWYTLAKLKDVYERDDIYRMYLDSPSYAKDVYGISAASRYFFGKKITECTYYEQAFLVALLSGTGTPLDPEKDYQVVDKYARSALKRLIDRGIITDVNYSGFKYDRADLRDHSYTAADPSYVDAAIREVKADKRFKVGSETLVIRTGYNKHASEIARETVDKYLATKYNNLQAAFVLVNWRTASVEAAIGSRVSESMNNRAFNMKRQTASTFKPIVYLTAFENGIRPSRQIEDKPYEFKSGPFIYAPRNYENSFLGKIPVRYGLVYSLNNATVKLAEETGLIKVRDMARQLGMKHDIRPFHAMALGSFPTTPLNVAQMFATIAAGGVRKLPSIVLSVEKNGKIYDMLERPTRVVSEIAAFQTLNIMQDVARHGTARGAKMLKGTAAKTGTSDKFRDAWTVAIFGDYIGVSWVGFDNYDSMAESDAGGRMAAPLISAFQHSYFKEGTAFKLNVPDDIVFLRVNGYSGYLTDSKKRGTYVEAYNKNNLPPKENK